MNAMMDKNFMSFVASYFTDFSRQSVMRHPIVLLGFLIALSGCELLPKTDAQQSQPPTQPGASARQGGGATPVDVAIARTGSLREKLEYIGTTAPARIVSLRAQTEGQLLKLNADVGDPVTKGNLLAQLDDTLLLSAVTQAEAELASRVSDVARAQAEVANARTGVEQARLEMQQAQSDAARLQMLYKEGAISAQQAEQALTKARTSEQAQRSAEEQVRTEKQAVAAALGRVDVQREIVAQAKERRSYALLSAPITGTILEKVTEPGNLVQPGGEILKIGDFSLVKVMVQVSEKELSNIRVGQFVGVGLDAFPNQRFEGEVTRISPVADPTARLVPVEITIPNREDRIGSGLLARVSFSSAETERVLVPQTALEAGGRGGRGAGGQGSRGASGQGSRGAAGQGTKGAEGQTTVFVVTGEGKEAKVKARSVEVGEKANGNVEILSGLSVGERFVTRSGKPLKDGDAVRLSVLSEKSGS